MPFEFIDETSETAKPASPRGFEFIESGTAAQPPASGKSWLSSAGDYLGEALASFNPKTIVQGVNQMVTHPIDTANSLLQAQGDLERKAEEAFKAGDYPTGIRHALNYLIPLLGPRLDQAGDYLAKGEIAKGLGATTDVGLQVAIPKALSSVPSIRIPSPLKNPNPVAAEAVEFAQAQGIPVGAGTATGNRAVQGGQWLSDRSLGGSPIAAIMEHKESTGLARVGEGLAAKSYPSSAVAVEQAGQGVRDAIKSKISDLHAEADTHGAALRAIEADPANTSIVPIKDPVTGVTTFTAMQIPVDLTAAKASLKPIYNRLARQYPITKQQNSSGFKALENIVNGPDFSPISQVESDLGTLKSLARGADLPELKNISQGVAANAVGKLSKAVEDAASKAPGAMDALTNLRKATRTKYEVADVLGQLREEPVQLFNQTTFSKDAGIKLLREVEKVAPMEMPKVGRAFLDDLVGQATADGAFSKRGTIATKWEKLGPETKKILFKDPAYVRDLDNFFRYVKMSGLSPNPSGSGHIVSLATQAGLLFKVPGYSVPLQLGAATLSVLLRSPAGVNLLTKGMKIPAGNKAAAASIVAELTKIAGGDLGLNPVSNNQD